ncbi:MAG TPA: helix-turn-helix domain-containing protein [Mycobacteriales bacterium]|nr:helix-turn-helix domain-containing protein [Mycobacteriales bacterium]
MDVPTWRRVQGASTRLSRLAVQRMEGLPWFAALAPQQRAEVGLVVQAGLAAFTQWLEDAGRPPTAEPQVFAAAPRELARAVSLKQTVQLIRVVVEVLEAESPRLAAPGEQALLAEHVLRYSREIAFAAAEVYAAAAEARGAWDARVEAGVVDALVRGSVGDLTLSRAGSLGWVPGEWATALAARAPSRPDDVSGEDLRTHARHHGLSVLSGEARGGLLVVVGGSGPHEPAVEHLVELLPEGPVVVGPRVATLEQLAGCVGEALAGLAAVPAWPDAPRPVESSALLAERALLGDASAARRLVEEVHSPLRDAGAALLETAAAYLAAGRAVEGAARLLFVHANTVRYRLRRISEVTGHDVTTPRGADVLQAALVLGRAQPL